MNLQNINRGHETDEHRASKAETLQFLKRQGYGLVFCEHQNCDLIAVWPSSAAILGVEIERSVRNVLNNIGRNIAMGCAHVLIVCPNFSVLAEIARKLDRELPQELREKVGIITLSALRLIAPA